MIERPAQDRIKTDQRDAERLVRLLMINGLYAVRVPSGAEEALRDLVRAREDLRGDLMRARHRLGKLLLRHDVRYDGTGDNWTRRHRDWLAKVQLSERGAQAALLDYAGAIEALTVRRDTVEATIAALVPTSPWAEDIARLRCLRGIDTLTAVGLCAEIGDFHRFGRPAQVMSYLGLVPSETSTGEQRRQGQITRSGSQHARRLLVEAAWHYRRPPRISRALERRQRGTHAAIIAISWKAQQRLHRLWRRLDVERGKRKTLVAVRDRPAPRRILLGDRLPPPRIRAIARPGDAPVSTYRHQMEAFAGPARETIDGHSRLLVRIRMSPDPVIADLLPARRALRPAAQARLRARVLHPRRGRIRRPALRPTVPATRSASNHDDQHQA
jgi:transposase